jgi:capsular polysaccharide transport system permease protein
LTLSAEPGGPETQSAVPYHLRSRTESRVGGVWPALRDRIGQRPFLLYMLLVAVLAGLYYGVIATPQYVSETRFAIRSREVVAPTGFLAGLIGAPSSLGDITAVSDYIRSPEMAETLDDRHQLRELFAQPRMDPFQTLPASASDEDYQRFYRRHVIVKLDREASTVIVVVKSFTPESARDTAGSVLELTEAFVNELSRNMREDTLRSATSELELAQKQAIDARVAVANFRGAGADLDPSASGAQIVGGIGQLEATAAEVRGEIASLLTYSRGDAPQVRQLRARLAAINAEIASLRNQQGPSANLAEEVTNYETLQLIRANAEKKLAAAETAFDQARATAEQREKFVARIVTPNLPETPTSPRRWLEFLTAMVFAMAGYALASLTLAAIRDHRGI